MDGKDRNESALDRFVRESSYSGEAPDTLVDSEKRFKDALTDLIDKAVELAVGKTLLILRDEGVLKVD